MTRPPPAAPDASATDAGPAAPIRLRVISGPGAGELLLSDDRARVIGRAPGADLTVDDPQMAPSHFTVRRVIEGAAGQGAATRAGPPPFAYRVRVEAPGAPLRYGAARVEVAELPLGARIRAGQTVFALDAGRGPEPPRRFGDAIGLGPAMQAVFGYLERVAASDLTVLIQGETGTGKELVAQAVHRHSPRAEQPFVVVDCSAIPRELIESTLFGHEKGAFTGAISQRQGLFERADGGTVFLDEIGELDMGLQPKLLRILESRELKRVGGHQTIRVDVRVIAATNRELGEMVEAGRFREDLYFRLGVVQVRLPPLRERRDDIPRLVEHFLATHAREARRDGVERGPITVSPDAMRALVARSWPGNVRELKNVVIRAASLADAPLLTPADFRQGPITPAAPEIDRDGASPLAVDLGMPFKAAKQQIIDRFEVEYLDRLLTEHAGNISRSAQAAGLTRYHLRALLKKHGRHAPK